MLNSIPFERVAAFIEELGAALQDTAAVEILPDRVTVTEYRHDGHGRKFMAGSEAAKVVTDIRIDRGGS